MVNEEYQEHNCLVTFKPSTNLSLTVEGHYIRCASAGLSTMLSKCQEPLSEDHYPCRG